MYTPRLSEANAGSSAHIQQGVVDQSAGSGLANLTFGLGVAAQAVDVGTDIYANIQGKKALSDTQEALDFKANHGQSNMTSEELEKMTGISVELDMLESLNQKLPKAAVRLKAEVAFREAIKKAPWAEDEIRAKFAQKLGIDVRQASSDFRLEYEKLISDQELAFQQAEQTAFNDTLKHFGPVFSESWLAMHLQTEYPPETSMQERAQMFVNDPKNRDQIRFARIQQETANAAKAIRDNSVLTEEEKAQKTAMVIAEAAEGGAFNTYPTMSTAMISHYEMLPPEVQTQYRDAVQSGNFIDAFSMLSQGDRATTLNSIKSKQIQSEAALRQTFLERGYKVPSEIEEGFDLTRRLIDVLGNIEGTDDIESDMLKRELEIAQAELKLQGVSVLNKVGEANPRLFDALTANYVLGGVGVSESDKAFFDMENRKLHGEGNTVSGAAAAMASRGLANNDGKAYTSSDAERDLAIFEVFGNAENFKYEDYIDFSKNVNKMPDNILESIRGEMPNDTYNNVVDNMSEILVRRTRDLSNRLYQINNPEFDVINGKVSIKTTAETRTHMLGMIGGRRESSKIEREINLLLNTVLKAQMRFTGEQVTDENIQKFLDNYFVN